MVKKGGLGKISNLELDNMVRITDLVTQRWRQKLIFHTYIYICVIYVIHGAILATEK